MPRLRCPACPSQILESVHEHGVEIDACVRCGGLWFDAGELAKLLQSYDEKLTPTGKVADGLGKRLGATDRPCPHCRDKLVEHELSADNPVAVDVCPTCDGVWLDHDELTHAQAGHQLADATSAIERERTWGNWLFQFFLVLPVEFNFQPRRRAYVTWTLIAINVVVFMLQSASPNVNAVVDAFALFPHRAGQAQWFVGMFTHNFLHAGIPHLLGNMYFLWILGDSLEDVLGHWKYLGFYMLVALAGGVTVTLSPFDPEIPRLGASGAVSGIMAAYAVLFRHSKLTFMLGIFQFKLSAPVYIGIWVAFNVAGLLMRVPGIAWEEHLGGFACGLIIALVAYKALLTRDPLLRLLNDVRLPLPRDSQ